MTETRYQAAYFDAVACMSVIEHQVPIDPFFCEMARILKKGGLLVVSTDYWDPKIDTGDVSQSYYVAGKQGYIPSSWTIFCERELEGIIRSAAGSGLRITGDFDRRCDQAPVRHLDRDYTFACMTFRHD